MRIWLDQVREEPFDWDETERVSPESLERPELLDLGPVTWSGRVVYTGPGFLLRARLSYEQTLGCIRCLEPHVESVGCEVELMIEIDGGRALGSENELAEKDMSVLVLDEEVLDTAPILLEQLQLNIPMKPLCRPDCLGLCPQCGADLNAGDCSCPEPAADPRWAAIAAFKGRLDR
ncbi:MAG TPA: YceD family protein [Thermoanaerobaculia bacterium]|nr:YceD family protein [Thermoanaerobaculia bacterium]